MDEARRMREKTETIINWMSNGYQTMKPTSPWEQALCWPDRRQPVIKSNRAGVGESASSLHHGKALGVLCLLVTLVRRHINAPIVPKYILRVTGGSYNSCTERLFANSAYFGTFDSWNSEPVGRACLLLLAPVHALQAASIHGNVVNYSPNRRRLWIFCCAY